MQSKKYLKIFLNLNLFFLFIFFSSCKTVGYDDVTTKNFKPEKGSVEADMWFLADRVEETLKNNHPLVIKDKIANDYVRGVFCKIEPDYCNKIRIYIVRIPQFNAGMFPNGMMLIHSSALLMLENEAQLASLMGHEFGHFFHRHGIKGYQQQESVKNLAAIFNVVAMLGSAYIAMNPYNYYNFDILNALEIGRLGVMMAQLTVYKYSLDMETQADMYGLNVLRKNGYHLDEAPKIWEKLIKAGKNPTKMLILSVLQEHTPHQHKNYKSKRRN